MENRRRIVGCDKFHRKIGHFWETKSPLLRDGEPLPKDVSHLFIDAKTIVQASRKENGEKSWGGGRVNYAKFCSMDNPCLMIFLIRKLQLVRCFLVFNEIKKMKPEEMIILIGFFIKVKHFY